MKCELYHDNFQNFKRYNIPKAQLVIADIPYAKQSFFHTDGTFKIAEYMHFCNRMLRKEPKALRVHEKLSAVFL